jgi:hypothetical protein
MLHRILVIAAGALLLAGAPIAASANDIVRANTQFAVDFAATNVTYGETEYGDGLDGEDGWVPGFSVTASSMKDLFGQHNLYAFGQITFTRGTTSYWAAGGPVTQSTDGAALFDADFRLGKGFDTGPGMMTTPYLGAGWHAWDRDLSNAEGPYGYHEKYSNGYVGAGVLMQVAAASRLVISGDALVGATIGADIAGTPNGGADIIPFNAGLGSSMIVKAGVAADYAITDRIHMNAGVDWTHFSYGQSAPFCIGPILGSCPNAYEPDSTSSYLTARVGLGLALP